MTTHKVLQDFKIFDKKKQMNAKTTKFQEPTFMKIHNIWAPRNILKKRF